ncbi:hypothetical protein NLI96_g4789 [Meripilus lineatus]|uniref:Heat shock protein 30 n=1 Tax=Meripilus lineatus TaxID=2056292 RepID=A0AAD5YEH3_9APHY|nr:hypothetical protein NLI96_g4789 [Physisporinus lineatus]
MASIVVNPPNADKNITNGATNWLWVVFGIMVLSFLSMVIWTFNRPRGTRLFHNIATVIFATASLAYFSMASDLGATPVEVEFSRGSPGTRQIWYVRYIQYFINFPLLLLLLLLPTGLSLSDVLTTAFFGWVVVISGLVGALIPSSYKWGFYGFGVASLIYIWFILIFYAPRLPFPAGPSARTEVKAGGILVVFMTMLYPVAWACSEGANVISPAREMVWYGIFDLITGPLFVFTYVFGLKSIDFSSFGLTSGKLSQGPGGMDANYMPNAGPASGPTGPGMVSTARGPTSTSVGPGGRATPVPETPTTPGATEPSPAA